MRLPVETLEVTVLVIDERLIPTHRFLLFVAGWAIYNDYHPANVFWQVQGQGAPRRLLQVRVV